MESSRRAPEEIATEAARAARAAAEEATQPEARFFLRQHALMLERIAAAHRRAAAAGTRAHGAAVAVLAADCLPV